MVFYFLAQQISEGMEPKKKWALLLSQAAKKNDKWVRKFLSWVIKMPLFNLCQYSLDYHQWRWAANGWQYPARNTTNKIIIEETQQNILNNSNTILYPSLNLSILILLQKKSLGIHAWELTFNNLKFLQVREFVKRPAQKYSLPSGRKPSQGLYSKCRSNELLILPHYSTFCLQPGNACISTAILPIKIHAYIKTRMAVLQLQK